MRKYIVPVFAIVVVVIALIMIAQTVMNLPPPPPGWENRNGPRLEAVAVEYSNFQLPSYVEGDPVNWGNGFYSGNGKSLATSNGQTISVSCLEGSDSCIVSQQGNNIGWFRYETDNVIKVTLPSDLGYLLSFARTHTNPSFDLNSPPTYAEEVFVTIK